MIIPVRIFPLVMSVLAATTASASTSTTPNIKITTDKTRVGIGRCITVSATVTDVNGKPAVRHELLPYVNGRRWGSHEYSDSQGKARFIIPLPNQGIQEIKVLSRGRIPVPKEQWIWSGDIKDKQTVFLQKSIQLPNGARSAELWAASDDGAVLFFNGKQIAKSDGWRNLKPIRLTKSDFRNGENLLSVEANNVSGPAGVLVNMTIQTPDGNKRVLSDNSWQAAETMPAGWPDAAILGGQNTKTYGGPADTSALPEPWPTIISRNDLIAGTMAPAGGLWSNTVQVRVDWRKLQTLPKNPDQLIGFQWEEWFTPNNCYWQTAQAVPLMGFYSSFDTNVLRQQAIWMIEAGADFIMADWSNNVWYLDDWEKHGEGINELVLTTTLMLETLAKMRDEGQEVPKFTLLTGICYTEPEGPKVVNDQLNFIYQTYLRNPRFAGLWQEFDGKPLVTMLDLPAVFVQRGVKLDDQFAIRYVGANLEASKAEKFGHWSWMDGLEPVVTYKDGIPEAVTASAGCFIPGGWLMPESRGRRNGATLLETFQVPLRVHPKVTFIHQFQEFAGQPEGQGHGPDKNVYVDSYSDELSDDIEPTSLTAPAYRGTGGWGFLYLNYTRALVDMYRQKTPQTTLIAVSTPIRKQVVTADKLNVKWSEIGVPAQSYTISVNGRKVADNIKSKETTINLKNIPNGPVTLRVTAIGTKSNYIMSWTEDSQRLKKPVEAYSEIGIVLNRKS